MRATTLAETLRLGPAASLSEAVFPGSVYVLVGLGLLLIVALFVAASMVRSRNRRGSPRRPNIVATRTADLRTPTDLAPHLVGSVVVYGELPFVAQTVSLLQRGVIRIDSSETRPGQSKLASLRFTLVDPARATRQFDRESLAMLFPFGEPGSTIELRSRDSELMSRLDAVQRSANAFAEHIGLTRRVAFPVHKYFCVGLLLCAVAIVVTLIAGGIYESTSGRILDSAVYVVGIIASVLFTIIGVVGLSTRSSRRTPAGETLADLRDHLTVFFSLPRDRMRAVFFAPGTRHDGPVATPIDALRVAEGLLPYAILTGQHKKWAAFLDELYAQAGRGPHWFAGVGAANASEYTLELDWRLRLAVTQSDD